MYLLNLKSSGEVNVILKKNRHSDNDTKYKITKYSYRDKKYVITYHIFRVRLWFYMNVILKKIHQSTLFFHFMIKNTTFWSYPLPLWTGRENVLTLFRCHRYKQNVGSWENWQIVYVNNCLPSLPVQYVKGIRNFYLRIANKKIMKFKTMEFKKRFSLSNHK